MKVVHLTTNYSTGGASIACRRIVEAQRSVGIDASIVTMEDVVADNVVSVTKSKFDKIRNFLFVALEKLFLLLIMKNRDEIFRFSTGFFGVDVTKYIKDADVVHIHWINSFLSLRGIKKIKNKKVWTLHDTWGITGGCHLSLDCPIGDCKSCLYLDHKWLTSMLLKKKLNILKDVELLAPSRKHCEKVSRSGLTCGVIPNPIKITDLPSKEECRKELGLPCDKKIIAFGAYNTNQVSKGYDYVVDISDRFDADIVVFGKQRTDNNFYDFGYVTSEEKLLKILKASDVLVSPSVEETFGLIVCEAMSVGTPAVCFENTGTTDIIDHLENGYVAKFKDANDFARGIQWCLDNDLSQKAIDKVRSKFSYERVGNMFKEYYL